MRPLPASTHQWNEDDRQHPDSWSGLHVWTIDGKRLGQVGDANHHYFLVQRGSLLPDYWLPTVLVRGTSDATLVLHVARDFVHRYATGSPPAGEDLGTEAT